MELLPFGCTWWAFREEPRMWRRIPEEILILPDYASVDF
jgi:hypothetical protein